MRDLSDWVGIITGSATGIGAATAHMHHPVAGPRARPGNPDQWRADLGQKDWAFAMRNPRVFWTESTLLSRLRFE